MIKGVSVYVDERARLPVVTVMSIIIEQVIALELLEMTRIRRFENAVCGR